MQQHAYNHYTVISWVTYEMNNWSLTTGASRNRRPVRLLDNCPATGGDSSRVCTYGRCATLPFKCTSMLWRSFDVAGALSTPWITPSTRASIRFICEPSPHWPLPNQ